MWVMAYLNLLKEQKKTIFNGGQHGSIQTYERALEKTKDNNA